MKVKVRAVILDAGRLVVVREQRLGTTRTLLPGGRVKSGESTEEALVRELREELGIEVEVERLVYVAEVFAAHKIEEVNLVFLARPAQPLPPTIELIDPLRSPENGLMPPIVGEIAADMERGWNGPARWLGNVWDPSLAPDAS